MTANLQDKCMKTLDHARALEAAFRTDIAVGSYSNIRETIMQFNGIKPSILKYNSDAVEIGTPKDLPNEIIKSNILDVLRAFCPWKKGPFRIFGTDIDAEWRSDLKWQRVIGSGVNVNGRRVLDVGCNNGYFMFRMLAQEPLFVVGIEPQMQLYWLFQLVNTFVKDPRLIICPIDLSRASFAQQSFDMVFCMGILYHLTDPIHALRKINEMLAIGGEIIIDCQGIDSGESFSLTPRKRYAGASGVWFLPSKTTLVNWLARANFRDIDVFFAERLTSAEQRRTDWADIKSLADFLKDDGRETVEGYPPPWRYYLRARK